MADLSTQVVEVVGAKTAALLKSEFEIELVEDLLRHYPRRYEQRGALTDLGNLEIGDHVTVQAQVKSFKNLKNAKGGTRQEVVISDGSGSLTLMFFNQHWREKDLVAGRQGLFAGQVSVFNNKRQLTHPEYELLDDAADVNPDEYAEAFLPVYPATKKLQTWTIERSIDLALSALGKVEDPLPADIRKTEGLIDLDVALHAIHKPTSLDQLEASRLRLKWDEALALQVVLAKQRHEEDSWPAISRTEKPDGLLAAFDARLPFTLTQGQSEVAKTISAENGSRSSNAPIAPR